MSASPFIRPLFAAAASALVLVAFTACDKKDAGAALTAPAKVATSPSATDAPTGPPSVTPSSSRASTPVASGEEAEAADNPADQLPPTQTQAANPSIRAAKNGTLGQPPAKEDPDAPRPVLPHTATDVFR